MTTNRPRQLARAAPVRVAAPLVMLVAFAAAAAGAEPATLTAEQILQGAAQGTIAVAEAVAELRALGAPAVAALVAEAPRNANARVARDRALIALGRPKPAVDDLLAWAASAAAPLEQRIAAIELVAGAAAAPPGTDTRLLSLMKPAAPPLLKVALARALWLRATTSAAQLEAAAVLQRALRSKGSAERRAAALALAEVGEFSPAVRELLARIKDEPGPYGRLARSLLHEAALTDRLLHPGAWGGSLGAPLLDEIRRLMKAYHVDPPLPDGAYVQAAARGLVQVVRPGDRFTDYFGPQQWRMFRQELGSSYAGIGAAVGLARQPGADEPVPTILRVLFDEPAPAFKAGLRAYDQIVAVDGKPAAKMSLEELSATLRGRADTAVTLSVLRYGWPQPKEITITRGKLRLPSARGRLLPGGVGYVRLAVFSDQTANDLETLLRSLERQEMRALVLDLRSNPGGRLDVVVKIADKFLKSDKLIATSAGRNREIAPRTEFRTTNPATHPDYPMVCLINGNSASGSELLAGALQDHRRATLVGEQSFGKGSVQRVFPLAAVAGQAALKLTIAEYFLPSGRSIHRKGVDPDIVVHDDSTEQEGDDFEALRLSGALDRYWAAHGERDHEKLEALARFDGNDAARYPGFDAWLAADGGDTTRDRAPAALRAWVRLRTEEALGREWLADLQRDRQLQRAIFELAQRVPQISARSSELYQWFFAAIEKSVEGRMP